MWARHPHSCSARRGDAQFLAAVAAKLGDGNLSLEQGDLMFQKQQEGGADCAGCWWWRGSLYFRVARRRWRARCVSMVAGRCLRAGGGGRRTISASASRQLARRVRCGCGGRRPVSGGAPAMASPLALQRRARRHFWSEALRDPDGTVGTGEGKGEAWAVRWAVSCAGPLGRLSDRSNVRSCAAPF